jgi:hypothetical protein
MPPAITPTRRFGQFNPASRHDQVVEAKVFVGGSTR